jgi:acetyltransferase-like isoleucine patch superfamily enzyme
MTSRDIPRAQDQLFKAGGGARAKYSQLVVGKPGWAALLKHELVVLVAQAAPGALGLALRKWMYPWLLGSCGRNVVFGQNVVLRHPHKIRIGDRVVIDDNCLLDAKGEANAGITIGSGVFVGRNTILSCKNGDIELGDEANVGFNCEIFSASRVRVGRGTLIAAYVYLIGGDHEFSDREKAVLDQRRVSAGISIGDGAVVRDAVPPGATAVGIPARLIGEPRES